MAEYSSIALQEVEVNENILLSDNPIPGGRCIVHRDGAGLITLRGITNQCKARYKVTFGANIAVPEGGTAEAISMAIALNGETVLSTRMIVTPAAVEEFFNIASAINVEVPCGCCTQISVKNTSTQTISVQNANLIVERIA